MKVICLLAAILIWGQVASSRYIVKDMQLPLNLYGLQEGLTLDGNDWPRTVQLRARISKWHFMRYRYFGSRLGVVNVDLSDVQPGGTWQREITVNDVVSPLSEIVITPPQRLLLVVDNVDSLRVPVRPAVSGELDRGRILLEPLHSRPDSLWVRGPSRFIRGDEVLRTEPVDLARLTGDTEVTRRLIMPHPHLRAEREDVTIVARVGQRRSRAFEHIAVVPLVDSDRIGVELFPPVATLTVSGPADSIETLAAARLSATVSLAGLGAGTHTLKPEVHLPPAFTLEAISPQEFMAVVAGDRR